MIREIIIQFIGAVGYSLVTLSYFKKKKRKNIIYSDNCIYYVYNTFLLVLFYLLNGISIMHQLFII